VFFVSRRAGWFFLGVAALVSASRVLAGIAGLTPVRRTILDARVRSIVVLVVCIAVFVRIVTAERAHLLDEMELAVLAAWVGFGTLAVRLSGTRFWPRAAPLQD
jgi:hypothetical protein